MCHWGQTWWYWRKNNKGFFLIHVTSPGQPQLHVRLLWKSTLMDPRLHLNISELVAGGREKTESYTWAPKALPGNDSSLLLTVYLTKKIHCVVVHDFNRVEMYNLHQERLLCGWEVRQLTASPLFCHPRISLLFLRRGLQSLIWNPWG